VPAFSFTQYAMSSESPRIETPDKTLVGTDGAALSSQPRRIVIFDTTLRDGEQSPGCSMNLSEKLEMAHALSDLGVDVIEAGFPIASPGDFEAVREVARQVRGPIIAALARCREQDIERALEAVSEAERARIHVFLATSGIHLEFKLKMTKEDAIRQAVASVKHAKQYCPDVEFSPEDAARTDDEFLAEIVTAVIEAGATTVNIPDTVGYSTPREFAHKIHYLRDHVPGIEKAVISVHCHDDLGQAVANSAAAVEAGAGQVECTINGIGERAGNCSLEEIVMLLKVRQDLFNCTTGINTPLLVPTSRRLAQITGVRVSRNKAIVGQNAFAHEAGIHQDGMLKEPTTYEIMRPEEVGALKSDLVLGKHSGRAALGDRLKSMGINVSEAQLTAIFEKFKLVADQKKELTDEDLIAMAREVVGTNGGISHAWELTFLEAVSGTEKPAKVRMTIHSNEEPGADMTINVHAGDGAIDAVMLAVQEITGIDLSGAMHDPASVAPGGDALSRYIIELPTDDGRIFRGRGVSTDTVHAAALAAVSLANAIIADRKRREEQLKTSKPSHDNVIP